MLLFLATFVGIILMFPLNDFEIDNWEDKNFLINMASSVVTKTFSFSFFLFPLCWEANGGEVILVGRLHR